MRRLAFALALCVAAPAFAQDKTQTLADLKTELGQLMAEFNALKTELVSSGAAASGAAGGDALQRLDAIEAALARLTSQAEAVEIKVNKVVADGTNRIGDMEYRLCEVTTGCDVANIGETPVLGADTAAADGADTGAADGAADGGSGDGAPTVAGDDTGGAELAVGEKKDFDRAKAVLASGDFRAAADLFATFTQSYPGSPLTQEAQFQRGEALAAAGDTAGAARGYLEAYSGAPEGEFAPESLLKLGQALGTLGQVPDACLTLAEVTTRFAGSVQAGDAATAMQGFGCQ